MNQRTLAIIIPFISLLGLFVVFVIAFIIIPKFLKEKNLLENERQEIASKKDNLSSLLSKIQSIEQRGSNIVERTAKPIQELASASIKMPAEKNITDFFQEFEEIFNVFEVKRLEFAYKERVVANGYITLPFETKLFGPYAKLRNIIAQLENWRNPLILNELELNSLSDDRGKAILRLSGSARFKAEGKK
ncbi:MAG: type 4a pilus biogenesis protein PilO [Candidatus Riflebacteria bacterium]|nr:type 4a pilus biogenesis protein PilO [Candidatus Riflebacteria bacterium]